MPRIGCKNPVLGGDCTPPLIHLERFPAEVCRARLQGPHNMRVRRRYHRERSKRSEGRKDALAVLGCRGRSPLVEALPYADAGLWFRLPVAHMALEGVGKQFALLLTQKVNRGEVRPRHVVSNACKSELRQRAAHMRLTCDFGRPYRQAPLPWKELMQETLRSVDGRLSCKLRTWQSTDISDQAHDASCDEALLAQAILGSLSWPQTNGSQHHRLMLQPAWAHCAIWCFSVLRAMRQSNTGAFCSQRERGAHAMCLGADRFKSAGTS